MKTVKLLLYNRSSLLREYSTLPLQNIELKHINTISLSALHPKGIVAFEENDDFKVLVKEGIFFQNYIISADVFAGVLLETFL